MHLSGSHFSARCLHVSKISSSQRASIHSRKSLSTSLGSWAPTKWLQEALSADSCPISVALWSALGIRYTKKGICSKRFTSLASTKASFHENIIRRRMEISSLTSLNCLRVASSENWRSLWVPTPTLISSQEWTKRRIRMHQSTTIWRWFTRLMRSHSKNFARTILSSATTCTSDPRSDLPTSSTRRRWGRESSATTWKLLS